MPESVTGERVTIRIIAFALLASLSLCSCSSMGPRTLQRDRFDYINAISESWKSQTLLNLVKIRYGDAPVFLDVASVINQYGFQGSVGLGASWFQNPFSSSQDVSAQGIYLDKPTITYVPMSGEQFARNLMTPIPPPAIVSLIQAGYPVDLVFRTTVHAINGIHSRYGSATRGRAADPEFYPLIERLRKIQLSGEIGMRVEKKNDQAETVFVFRRNPNPETEADRAEVKKLLGIDPQAEKLSVVYGSLASSDHEIALLTRSVLEILTDLASYIEVPQAYVEEGRTYSTPPPDTFDGTPVKPLIEILTSPQSPPDAFAAVSYRGNWYWIDDKDFRSKNLFSFIMFLFTLTETDNKQGAPVITLPAG